MRIIAGMHKGRKLSSLPGKTTRPTSGKVREAIFSIHGDSVRETAVLDLFAGTGAFGLEALSRGAANAVFIDSDRRSISVIRKNIELCGEKDRSIVICADIALNPNIVAASGRLFDLVFMDPPYGSLVVRRTLEGLEKQGVLAKGAILVIEHDKHEEIPTDMPGMEITDRRKYGKTFVTFMEYL